MAQVRCLGEVRNSRDDDLLSDDSELMIAGILDCLVDVFADTVEYEQDHFAMRVF